MRERGLLREDTTFVIHAGRDYYGELVPLLEHGSMNIEIPTGGLGLGEKQAWYKERL